MRKHIIPQKRNYEYAVKRSISMPEVLLGRAVDRQRARGMTKFSAYIQSLVESDLSKSL